MLYSTQIGGVIVSKFVIRPVATGIKFDLRAGNGEIIATSEVYANENACRRGVASVQKNAPGAAVEDRTAAEPQRVRCPKFEVYTDKRGAYRFRLKAANGQIIAVSEPYTTKAGCLAGIESVQKNSVFAEICPINNE